MFFSKNPCKSKFEFSKTSCKSNFDFPGVPFVLRLDPESFKKKPFPNKKNSKIFSPDTEPKVDILKKNVFFLNLEIEIRLRGLDFFLV